MATEPHPAAELVMKGRRGGDFERQLFGEVEVQLVVSTLVMITVLPGTATNLRSLMTGEW